MNDSITANIDLTPPRAAVAVHEVAVIARFKTFFAGKQVAALQTIAAGGCAAVVQARIGVACVAVIASLIAGLARQNIGTCNPIAALRNPAVV